jgi:hypothetical protein
VTAAPLATQAEVEAAIVETEVRLAGYRHDLEELEAESQDMARVCELVHGVEAQLALLRERKKRLLTSEPRAE